MGELVRRLRKKAVLFPAEEARFANHGKDFFLAWNNEERLEIFGKLMKVHNEFVVSKQLEKAKEVQNYANLLLSTVGSPALRRSIMKEFGSQLEIAQA